MDKRDINWTKMPTFCDKKFSACRKFIFIFIYAFTKISVLFNLQIHQDSLKFIKIPKIRVKLGILALWLRVYA
jgi:hypothetical protein